MSPEEREAVRKLLIKYQSMISLAEELALTLLDTLQPDGIPLEPGAARERRKEMGDALAMIESGDDYANQLWAELGLDRRSAPAPPHASLPPDVPRERRKSRRPHPKTPQRKTH